MSGGELHLMPYSEIPADFPPKNVSWIIHARLAVGPLVLMASDSRPDMPVHLGNIFFVSVNCERIDETEKFFKALGDSGIITMPLQETF